MLWQLATDPELRHRIAADPSLTPGVVEEFLRYWAPVQPARRARGRHRGGRRPVQGGRPAARAARGGQPRRPGVPRRLRRSSPSATPTATSPSGRSIHRCLGSHIARIEMRVLLDELLRRLPDFELQAGAEAEWSKGQVQGVVQVPITFPPGKRESAERLETGRPPEQKRGHRGRIQERRRSLQVHGPDLRPGLRDRRPEGEAQRHRRVAQAQPHRPRLGRSPSTSARASCSTAPTSPSMSRSTST